MQIDLILLWPNNCDYPLWRQFIRDNRNRLNRVIIVFTETNVLPKFQEFVQKNMMEDNVTFITNRDHSGNEDWRDVATNEALKYSDSEWVWFTEQDFIINDSKFWQDVQQLATVEKSIAVFQDFGAPSGALRRMHPCCWFLHKTILSQIKKDFSAKPPEYDHFGCIQKQLHEKGILTAVIPENTYLHLNGLSHNWYLIQNGQKPIDYNPGQFKLWLTECLKVRVPLLDSWKNTAKRYLESNKSN
ncbi:hypothetical protein [Peribacillus simplex]|uniref:hypothetical protein n=1 Tax=Peribacillus simplex TaxID=1478 RepID=UPI00366CDBA9